MTMQKDLRRLANSVLWPGFLGGEAPDWLLDELRDGLAGVVYFAQNTGGDVAKLSAQIRDANPAALIGIDEEGGNVTRLEAGTGSTLPGAAQLGVLDDTAATAATGREIARRLREVGVDLVIAPVADVNTDPRNPVIGVRAFGDDVELVTRHVLAEIDGIQSGGVAACVKHFPGHGDTYLDSHHALPVTGASAEELVRTHLAPFRAAVDAGVYSIMTAHIVVPGWGAEPATLNPGLLGILREWGYEGVIITDALDMAAVRETVGIGGGAVRALAAGADLLCIGNPTNPGENALADQDIHDFRAARDAIVEALTDGTLPIARVEEAAARVATLTARLAEPVDLPDESHALDDVVRRALTVRGTISPSSDPRTVIDARSRPTLAVDDAGDYVADAIASGGTVSRVDAGESVPSAYADVVATLGEQNVVVVDRVNTSPEQRALIEAIAQADPSAVIVNVGLPAHEDLPLATIDVAAASAVGARAVAALLRGE